MLLKISALAAVVCTIGTLAFEGFGSGEFITVGISTFIVVYIGGICFKLLQKLHRWADK